MVNFVPYHCKNPNCNEGWVDEDITNVQSKPPKWKYCKSCCEKMGIDFDAQIKPKKKLSQRQLETLEKHKFHKRKN